MSHWPKWLRWVFVIGILLTSGFLILMASGYLPWGQPREGPTSLPSHPPEADEPAIQFSGVEFVGRKEGKKQYQLYFDKVKRSDETGLVTFENLKEGFIFQENDAAYRITAKAGSWLEAQDDFELEGDINITRADELELRSQKLKWDGKTEIITIPVPAQLTIDGLNATSRQLEAHVKTDRLYLQGDVVMWDEDHTIRSEQVIYDRKAEELHLIGSGEIDFLVGGADAEED
ncbi:MAG: LPS export ABC transporter periplasmic protein LptC [Firmicutes bacterium]|nr:LPS export ABC transporter periplasmic protein LptC [Bacillota bacterium]